MDYRKKALKYQKRYNELLQMRGGAGSSFDLNPMATDFTPANPDLTLTDEDHMRMESFLDDFERQKDEELEREYQQKLRDARDDFEDYRRLVENEAATQRGQVPEMVTATQRARTPERERRQQAERAAASSQLTLTPVIPSAFLTESPQPRSRVQQQVTATPMPVIQTPRSRTPERVEESVTATPVRSRVQESRTSTPGRQSRFNFSSVRDTFDNEASTPMEQVRPGVQESRTSTPGRPGVQESRTSTPRRQSRFDFSSVRDNF